MGVSCASHLVELVTVAAGVIADIWGPTAGGLFLAFPAIFCASATLIEAHQRQQKERKGLMGAERGKNAGHLRPRLLDSVTSHSSYSVPSHGHLQARLPRPPFPSRRSPGSSSPSRFSVSGARCVF